MKKLMSISGLFLISFFYTESSYATHSMTGETEQQYNQRNNDEKQTSAAREVERRNKIIGLMNGAQCPNIDMSDAHAIGQGHVVSKNGMKWVYAQAYSSLTLNELVNLNNTNIIQNINMNPHSRHPDELPVFCEYSVSGAHNPGFTLMFDGVDAE